MKYASKLEEALRTGSSADPGLHELKSALTTPWLDPSSQLLNDGKGMADFLGKLGPNKHRHVKVQVGLLLKMLKKPVPEEREDMLMGGRLGVMLAQYAADPSWYLVTNSSTYADISLAPEEVQCDIRGSISVREVPSGN